MREYDQATLKKLQQYELGILRDFVKVCEENNLSYFGFAGTGIGALRHGGFIPWDDDIDVAIPREDYEKLIEIFKRDFSDKYDFVDAAAYDDYPLMTARISLKNSAFIGPQFKRLHCPLGIFLDVFLLDKAASNPKEHKRQQRRAWIYGKLLILKHVPFPRLPFGGVTAKLIHAATWFVWLLLNVFGVSHQYLYKKALSYSTKYNDQPAEKYEYFFTTKLGAGEYTYDDIFPLRKLDFEGLQVCFPHHLEKDLTKTFGDYMQLPPPEKRKNHFPCLLQFPGEEPMINE